MAPFPLAGRLRWRRRGGSACRRDPRRRTAGGTVTIDFWHSESAANADTLERLVSRYNSSQDEVTVRPIFQGGNEELMAKLTASLGSGQVPAVALLVEADTQKMIDSGAVAPIQDFVDREDYDLSDLNETLVRFYSAKDKLWVMPLCGGVPLLYYNKVVFREVGLDPEKPPRDLEEVRQYSEKILKRDGAGNVVRSGIALESQDWQERMVAEHDDLFVDNENGHEGRATKVLFDNDTERWFFQWWHDMVDEGLAFNVGRNPTYADSLLAIGSGRAAMAFSFSSALRSVIDVVEKGAGGRGDRRRRTARGARRYGPPPSHRVAVSRSSTCGRRKSRKRPGSSSSGSWSRSSRPSGSPAAATCP